MVIPDPGIEDQSIDDLVFVLDIDTPVFGIVLFIHINGQVVILLVLAVVVLIFAAENQSMFWAASFS